MPHRLLSQLAHVELLTATPEESVEFATSVLGLDVVEQQGDSVYLRCWGDYYAYSLVLSEGPEPALGHAAWRSWNAEQLEVAVASVEAHGIQGEWIESSFGHGRSYRFNGPAGHPVELFWDVDRAVAPDGEESSYPERPQRTGSHGCRVRMLDHCTVTAPDVKAAVEWHRDALDFRIMGALPSWIPGSPEWFFSIATQNEKSHDFGFIHDFDGIPGRLHHVAFWVETVQDLVEGAKTIIERGHEVDYGPGQHGMGEQHYLYFRDPVGLRYELNSGGYRNYVPDWETPIWTIEEGCNNAYRTEIGLPAVHMVAIPPGQAGAVGEEQLEGPVAKA